MFFIKKYRFYTLSILILLFLFSCGGKMPFDPRAYNSNNWFDGGTIVPEDPDVELPDPEDDPFLKPENNNPDEHFPAANFDNWVISASFAKNNTPTFWYIEKQWNINDPSKNEYTYVGAETTGGGFSIKGVKYYLYKGKNNLFTFDGSYNTGPHGERLERFQFYRFTGTAAGIQPLDNMLVVVDRYTKLVFAYAIPTKFNAMGAPTQWGSVDTKLNGGKYKFYEYDPAGIVNSDGTIELFQWYTRAMGRGNYNPIIGDPRREVATYGKPGRSPYMVVDENLKLYGISVKAKSLKNLNIKSHKRTWNGKWPEQNEAYLTYAIRSSLYTDGNASTYDVLSHKNDGNIINFGKIKDDTDTISLGATKDFTTTDNYKEYLIDSTDVQKYILELDTIVTKYGWSTFGYVEQFEKWTKVTYNNYGAPSIKFVYDKTQEAFVIDTENSNLDKTTVDTSFKFKAGEGSKEFIVNYNNESEITYIIEFKEKAPLFSRRFR